MHRGLQGSDSEDEPLAKRPRVGHESTSCNWQDETEGDMYQDDGPDESGDDSGPTVPLGANGRFRLILNAMSVPGFHVAVNVFSEALQRELFLDEDFTSNTYVH